MTEFTKIAVTVPTETYADVERLRRRLGKSRSAVVALALEEWLRGADVSDADRRYVEGYRRVPEGAEALDQLATVAAQGTSHWDAWAPGAPARAAEPVPPRSSRSGRSASSGGRSKRKPQPRRRR